MSVYDEFPTAHLITTKDPRAGVPRERRLKAIPAAAWSRYYTDGVGFNLQADWDSLRTPEEMRPEWTPPPAPAPEKPARLQFGPWVWAPLFSTRPYTVDGIPPSTHPFYWYRATAQRWWDQHGRWLVSTYNFSDDHAAIDRVASAISDIERARAKASGANVS